jgi:DNA-binding transcriptional regulator GbsR (MarR family)
VENSTETAYTRLSVDEKKKLYETVKAYNEYRTSLKSDNVYETTDKIIEAINLAERYVISECNEWMEAKMVQQDMKDIKKKAVGMYAEVQKIKAIEKQLEMLYEEVGVRLDRYFEITNPKSASNQ